MALRDFYGDFNVLTASGTEFGLDTTVTIAAQEDDGTVPVLFTGPGGNPTVRGDGIYDNRTDALRVTFGDSSDDVFFISRFVDPTPGSNFAALYSLVVKPVLEGSSIRLPVWSAERTSAGTGADNAVATNPLAESEFARRFLVQTTANTQFGSGSKVEMTQQSNGYLGVSIIDALGSLVFETAGSYDRGTVSIYGWSTGTFQLDGDPELVPVIAALSVAQEGQRTFVYGNFVIGDPEQGGTFGGEEGNPDEPDDDPVGGT